MPTLLSALCRQCFGLLLGFLICAPFFTRNAAAQRVSVVAQHGDLARTGWNTRETVLTVENVSARTFGKAYSVAVDDQIYAQPLVMSRASIGGGAHNVVYVATVNNTVYAIDADKSLIYWQKNYSPAGQRAPRNTDMTGACGGYYTDFTGNMGIVGTPAIDSVSQTMYFVARSTDGRSYFQYLHAIDLGSGAERAGSPQLITASCAGTGDGSVGGVVSFNAQTQNQRSGLLLLNGIVYISYASHCDWGPYHGWMLGYDAQTLAQKVVYNTTPDGYNGGIWMAGAAPAADEEGNIYVAVGNGSIGVSGNLSSVRNRSESAVKLARAGTTLAVSSFFTPKNYQELENADLDFGSSQMLLLPDTKLVMTGCKDGSIYLMNRDNMGGISSTANQVVQTISLGSGKGLRSSFAYYQGASREYFYTWSENAALKAFPFNRASGTFDVNSVVIASAQGPTGANGAMMAGSSNGTAAGTGILWAAHAATGDANHSVRPGILRAFDATDVTREIWNSMQNSDDDIGSFAKFVCPTVANGKVYMATFSGQLVVYGLVNSTVPACNVTTNVALNKPAVASGTEDPARYPAAAAVDNNNGTRWASTLGVDPQWIYVDLQAQYDICRVALSWEAAVGKDFLIQVSDDALSWKTVKTITGNAASINNIQLSATGRYVRMYGTARGTEYGYSLYDFQVFGTVSTPPVSCPPPVNLIVTGQTLVGAHLSWDVVPGTGSYIVAYKAVSDVAYTTINASTNNLTLTTLSCGTDYLFKVQAVCSATATSAFSGDKAFSTLVCDASCGILPTRWYTQDVGTITLAGQACYRDARYRLRASGPDMGNSTDNFRFAYKTFGGDGQLVARVDSLDATTPGNKAGVMFRETLTGNSRYVLMALSSGHGAVLQYRQTTGGASVSSSPEAGISVPYFVRLIKRGTHYTGYISQDSLTWKTVGPTVDLGFGEDALEAGLALSSPDERQLSRAVFSHVPIIISADTTAGLVNMGREVALYPNPATRSVTLALPEGQAEEIAIWNVNGQLVRHFENITRQPRFVIPLQDLHAGLYLVLVRSRGQKHVKRLIKLPE